MAVATSLQTCFLDLPPSCLSICPQHPSYFVIGTYLLHKSSENDANSDEIQKRSGSLMLWRVDDQNLTHVATELTPEYSILDLQWSPHRTSSDSLLAVATSIGSLSFWTFDNQSTSHTKLVHVATHQICDPFILVLYLQWHPSRATTIGVTLSDGRVCLCEASEPTWTQSAQITTRDVAQHSLEAWCLAFVDKDILSGGDDMVFQRITTTNLASVEDEVISRWQDKRSHQAGVTFILPLDDTLIITGSYDDHIRLLSAPKSGPRRILADLNLDGGVWRLKVLQGELGKSEPIYILASCMYAGARIVKLTPPLTNDESWSCEVVARFEEHESMNYASDSFQSKIDGKHLIISTSFYDRRLCLWETENL